MRGLEEHTQVPSRYVTARVLRNSIYNCYFNKLYLRFMKPLRCLSAEQRTPLTDPSAHLSLSFFVLLDLEGASGINGSGRRGWICLSAGPLGGVGWCSTIISPARSN